MLCYFADAAEADYSPGLSCFCRRLRGIFSLWETDSVILPSYEYRVGPIVPGGANLTHGTKMFSVGPQRHQKVFEERQDLHLNLDQRSASKAANRVFLLQRAAKT